MAEHAPRPLTGYVPTLDGWRAVAVSLVILGHVSNAFSQTRDVNNVGEFGVSIFFGISGILITSRLLEEQRVRGSISLKGFYVRRAFRILPPFFLLLIFLALARLSGIIASPWYDWLRCLFLVRNYGQFGTCWYTMHVWSLSVEEHFYLIWPAILVLLGPKKAIKVALIASLAINVWRMIRVHYELFPFLGDTRYNTDTEMDILLFAAATALLLSGDTFRKKVFEFLSPPVTLFVLFVFAGLVAGTFAVDSARYRHGLRLIEPVLICTILTGTILRPDQFLGRVLQWGWIKWIGRLSYSLYLWQQIFTGTNSPSDRVSPALSFFQKFPLNVVAIFFVASLSYYLLERPMLAIGHRLARPASPGRGDLKT